MMKKSRVFVYGFGPYGSCDRNITEEVISSLQLGPNVITKVFETKFSRAMFLEPVRHYLPSVIIGLGQHPTARKLRLERKAVNLMARRGAALKPISKSGPPYYRANLLLPSTRKTTITYQAGTYVCNFSMYIYLDYCGKTDAKFAFIHIPRAYKIPTVTRYIERVIDLSMR